MRRRNPKRRRRSKRRRRNPARTLYRRRNPRVKFKGAAMSAGLATLGGAIGYGIHWGTTQIPVGNPWAKLAIFAGAGYAGSVGISMLADDRVGAGTAGAVGYALAQELAMQLYYRSKPQAESGAVYVKEGGAVYRLRSAQQARDAGAVYRAEAGAVVGGSRRDAGQFASSMRPGVFGTSFKDSGAGASTYVPGPVRWYGPQSWAYRYGEGGAPRRYVSAHNSR